MKNGVKSSNVKLQWWNLMNEGLPNDSLFVSEEDC